MAIKTKKMSDWLAQNGQAITNASKASMLKAVNDEVTQLQDGVFIVFFSEDNVIQAVTPYKWAKIYKAKNNIANGVMIVEGGHYIVIAPTDTQLPWASGGSDTGAYRTDDMLSAMQDWAGKNNTAKIIAASKDGAITNTEAYAAGFCNKYSKTNKNGRGLTAGRWWLPSVAELMMIYANRAKINHALSLIDGAQQLSESWYWSSTENNTQNAWLIGMDSGYIRKVYTKNYKFYTRPVSTYIE